MGKRKSSNLSMESKMKIKPEDIVNKLNCSKVVKKVNKDMNKNKKNKELQESKNIDGNGQKPKKIINLDATPCEVNIMNELVNKPHKNSNDMKFSKTLSIDEVKNEVASNRGQTNITPEKKIQNINFDDNEESIKDDDIDKFCDELTTNDNIIFDNWVKLIEAKLHSKNK